MAQSLPLQVMESAKSLGATFNSLPGFVSNMLGFSIQIILTGTTPNGTAKLQCSNDGINWDDVTGQSQAFTDVGTKVFNVSGCYYNFVRVVYTRTSGTGSMAITLQGKNG